MKKKAVLIIGLAVFIAVIACFGVFFGRDGAKMEKLFSNTVAVLDSGEGLKELFNNAAIGNSPTLDADIAALNEFYQGKSVEVKNPKVYHEAGAIYRMHATIVTDKGKYFISIAATGARMVDNYGIQQLVIEDSKEFEHKKIFKKDEFAKYNSHAAEFGVTIRTKGD